MTRSSLLALALVLAACDGELPPGAPDDASVPTADAGTRDAGELPAESDAGPDEDAGTRDAGPSADDAGPDAGPPEPVRIVELSDHCALRSDGEVRCWGEGRQGQLGQGAAESRDVAVRALLPGPASAIGCTSTHCCAIVDGEVWCWGANSAGQVGRYFGDSGFPYQHATPVRAMFDGTATMVAAGPLATCVVDDVGALWCWGQPLTEAENAGQHVPRRFDVKGGGPALGLAVGSSRACVLADRTEDGARGAFCVVAGESYATWQRECDAVTIDHEIALCTLDAELYCWRTSGSTRPCWNGEVSTPWAGPMDGYGGVERLDEGCAIYADGSFECGAGRRTGLADAFDVARGLSGLKPACATDGTGVYCGEASIAGVMD